MTNRGATTVEEGAKRHLTAVPTGVAWLPRPQRLQRVWAYGVIPEANPWVCGVVGVRITESFSAHSTALFLSLCVCDVSHPVKASSSPTMRRHQPFGRGQRRLLLLVLAFAGLGAAQEEPQDRGVVLGSIKRAPGAIHELTPDELCASVAQYGVTPPTTLSSDMEDRLRLTLYEVRHKLLARRNEIVMHAERVVREVHEQSGNDFVTHLSLDDVVADDNAIYASGAKNRILAECQTQTGIGALLALFLTVYAPLGRLHRGAALLPSWLSIARPMPPARTPRYLTITLAGSALLALLQLTKDSLRALLGAPSLFCEKLAAIVCREGIFEWVAEAEEHEEEQIRRGGEEQEEEQEAKEGPLLLARRGVAVPVLLLASGSSIFEESVFRGVLLHGLITRARLRPWLASLVSSAIFGIAHVGNEADQLRKAIYAAWTFAGGMIFSGAYVATGGGCLVPILLHFGLNSIIFGDSARKVAQKVWNDRQEMRKIVAAVSAAPQPASSGKAQDGGHGPVEHDQIGNFRRMKMTSLAVDT